MTDTVCLSARGPGTAGSAQVGVIHPGPAGTPAELLWHPQPSSRPSLTRVTEAEESWGWGNGKLLFLFLPHFFLFHKGRGDLLCPPQNQVCILVFSLNPQQPSGAFHYGVMEHKQAISQVEQCQGESSTPSTASHSPVVQSGEHGWADGG